MLLKLLDASLINVKTRIVSSYLPSMRLLSSHHCQCHQALHVDAQLESTNPLWPLLGKEE
jgi:hypothetical protein